MGSINLRIDRGSPGDALYLYIYVNCNGIYPVRIKYKVFEKVVLKVRTTRVISLDKIYNGVIYFIPYVNIQYTIYIYISKSFKT